MNSSAKDVLAAVNAKHAAKRSAGAAKATQAAKHSPASLTQQDLQALLDSCCSELPGVPRVIVTAKHFGVLRKRLKEAPPSDLRGFLLYTLGQWGIVASRQQKSLQKSGQVVRTPLGSAPNFSDLCYRYPYFLKIFQGHEAETSAGFVDQDKAEIAKLRAVVSRQQQAIGVLQKRVVVGKREPGTLAERSPAVVPRPVRRPAPVAAILRKGVANTPQESGVGDQLGEDNFPDWDDAQ